MTRCRAALHAGLAGLIGAALLVGGAACASEAPEEPAPKPEAAETAPAPEPSEEPWERFTDERMVASFEVPPGWTVQERSTSSEADGIVVFDLLDPAGEARLHLSNRVMGLGGACGDAPPLRIVDLDPVPLTIPGYVPASEPDRPLVPPSFGYRVAEIPDGSVIGSLAVTDTAPEEYCFSYNLLSPEAGLMYFADTLQMSASDAKHVFPSMEEAKAFMQTEEYATQKRVLMSLRLDS